MRYQNWMAIHGSIKHTHKFLLKAVMVLFRSLNHDLEGTLKLHQGKGNELNQVGCSVRIQCQYSGELSCPALASVTSGLEKTLRPVRTQPRLVGFAG